MPVVHLRAHAFQAHGVVLKHPAHSWSGVRAGDGTVVFALPAQEVRVDQRGLCCLLWGPGRHGASGALERVAVEERLEHCQLALQRGDAAGFLLHEDLPARDERLFRLDIVRAGEKYWARWAQQHTTAAAA